LKERQPFLVAMSESCSMLRGPDGRPPSERTTPRKKGALLDADGGFAGNGGSDADDD
jgi:hypothetical protein